VSVYVGFRRKRPDRATMNRALENLKDNNIDVRLLVEWPADHCQQAGSKRGKKFHIQTLS